MTRRMMGRKKKTTTQPENDNKTSKKDAVLSMLKQKLGKSSFYKLSDKGITQVPAISTKLAGLDYSMGCMGLPLGRILEVWGQESSCKTSWALAMCAAIQDYDEERDIHYIDAEHALSMDMVRVAGLDPDRTYIHQPDNAEEALNTITILAETGVASGIVLDSVAALAPQAEIEGEIGDYAVGVMARLMGQTMRKSKQYCNKNNTILIVINQIRHGIGPYSGETLPGGNAPKFFSSLRYKLKKESFITEGDETIGIEVFFENKKNKVGPPMRHTTLSFYYDRGFSKGASLLDVGVKLGIIQKAGAWFSYGDIRLGQGKKNASEFLESEQVLFDEIYQKFLDKLQPIEHEEEEEDVPMDLQEMQHDDREEDSVS